MRLKNPEAKIANILYLSPVPLLVIVLLITGHAWWEYLRGDAESIVWAGMATAISVYFAVRSWIGVSNAIDWGDEEASERAGD